MSHWHAPDRKKACIRCGEEKPLGEFAAYPYTTRQGKRSTRYESRCKPCARVRTREYFAANPDVLAEQNGRRRQRDPDIFKRQSARYRATERGRQAKAKAQRLRKARMRSGAGDDAAIRAIYAEALEVQRIVSHCPVFDLPELGKAIHVDHIKALARGGKHVAGNLQVLPGGLNLRKGTR